MSIITQSRPVRVSINNNNRRRRRLELPLKPFSPMYPVPVTRIVATTTMPESATTPKPTPSPALPTRDRFPATNTLQQQQPVVRSLLDQDQDQAPPLPLPLVQVRLRVRVRAAAAARSNVRGARQAGIGPPRRSGGTCLDLRTRTQAWQHESDNSPLANRP
jgi:hypothetical protein